MQIFVAILKIIFLLPVFLRHISVIMRYGMLDADKNPILYSVGTELACRINRYYYGDVHYVWCATAFHSETQPATSDPQTIANRWLQIIKTSDRHAKELDDNKAGIIRGADKKFKAGNIDETTYNLIRQMVNVARYIDFYPVLYLIHSIKVSSHCNEVPLLDRASNCSEEYLIEDLSGDEFDIIEFKMINHNIINVSDLIAGD